MRNYFTISEFAHLRNININSLRYYEKIGVLKPSYVDPENNYRYYSPEQLYHLDMIRLCIDLGMPLKELFHYVDSQGELQISSLFQDGKQIVQEKMEEIQRNLKRIEHSLEYFDITKDFEHQSGLYTRHIKSRKIFTTNDMLALENVANIEAGFTHLFEQAQTEGLSPVLPSGIIITYAEGQYGYRQFFEVVGDGLVHDDLMTIPEGNYQCLQVGFQTDMDIIKIIEESSFFEKHSPIIVSNMFLSKFHIGNIKTELQQIMFSP